MLICFNKNINFGDLFITTDGNKYLVIENIFSDDFPVLIIDLEGNRSDDEFIELSDIYDSYDILEVIRSNKLMLTQREGV